jgi:drug/metabolite transporter (DMT)-like permease
MKTVDALQLLLLSMIWGVSFLLIKIAGVSFPPVWLACLRLLLGGMILYAILKLNKRKMFTRENLPWLVLQGLIGSALPFTFFALGEQTLNSSLAGVLNATTPCFAALIGVMIGDSSLNSRRILGVVLGFVGVMVAVSGSLQLEGSLVGVTVITLASILYAIVPYIAKRFLKDVDPLAIAFGQVMSAGLMMIPIMFLSQPGIITLPAIGAILILGIFGSGIAYAMFYSVLPRISATQSSSITYVIPIWSILWGALYGEHIGLETLVGITVVIFGVILINTDFQFSRKQPA